MGMLAINIMINLVAAALFLVMLSKLKPNLEVSKVIADRGQNNGVARFAIKVINKGRRNAINVRAELSLVRVRIVPNGSVSNTRRIPLKKDSVFILQKYDKSDQEAHYAFRFTTDEDYRFIMARRFNAILYDKNICAR